MSWDAIGAIGNLVGGAGVIVTLAYLAVQMRLNTAALRNETRRDAMQMIINSYSPIIVDDAIAAIYLRGMDDFVGLSDVEKIRFHYVCCQRLHAASVNQFFNATGKDPSGIRGLEVEGFVYRMMRRPGFRQWWEQRGRGVMDPEFIEFADQLRDKAVAAGS